jgi:hypothetical protein
LGGQGGYAVELLDIRVSTLSIQENAFCIVKGFTSSLFSIQFPALLVEQQREIMRLRGVMEGEW